MAATVSVELERMGVWRDGGDVREVARVRVEHRPAGPAENALIELREAGPDGTRARYLSWIGYGDLDEALELHPGKLELVEPAESYRVEVTWQPFGDDAGPSLSRATGR